MYQLGTVSDYLYLSTWTLEFQFPTDDGEVRDSLLGDIIAGNVSQFSRSKWRARENQFYYQRRWS